MGLDRRGWHRLEQLSLRDDWRVIGVTDPKADRRAAARVSFPTVYDNLDDLLAAPGLDGVLLTDPPQQRGLLVEKCLNAGREVWVEPPLSDDLRQARRLQSLARERKTPLHVVQTRRFDRDYRQALAALASGRLGTLRSIRLVSAEWTTFLGDQGTAVCPLVDPVAQFGPHGFDQLIGMIDADPHWIWARRCSGEDGFLAVIGFTNEVTVQIEVRRRARATCHTGWVIEGEGASYQQGRLITVASDGELIDEPVAVPTPIDDPLMMSLWGEGSDRTVDERRAWLTVALIQGVRKSCGRNAAIRWDEVVGG